LKRLIVSLLGLVLGLLVGAQVQAAELKVGFVNGQRIISEAPQSAKAKKKIEKEFEKRNDELQKMAKQIQSLQEQLEKNSVTMTEADRRNKDREAGELNRDFQRKKREFQEDINLRQNEEVAAIYERANKVVKQIAEAEKYDLIVQEAVYFSPRIDITDKVLKALAEAK